MSQADGNDRIEETRAPLEKLALPGIDADRAFRAVVVAGAPDEARAVGPDDPVAPEIVGAERALAFVGADIGTQAAGALVGHRRIGPAR